MGHKLFTACGCGVERKSVAPIPAEQNNIIYPSYFKLHVRWLRLLNPVTYLSKHLGILRLAAFLQLELFWVKRVIQWETLPLFARKE
jgi:hypothetical protein